MSKRYSKLKSSFIFRKEHTDVKDGTIFERDWVTIGSKHKIEPGKKPVYGEGNFIFTDNAYVDYRYKKKYTNDEDIIAFDKPQNKDKGNDDLFDIKKYGNNLSDFIYYGSAVELIRATIDKIIREFPTSIKASVHKLTGFLNEDNTILTEESSNEYIIFNPFNIDFLTKFIGTSFKQKNTLRYLYISADKYKYKEENITSYVVDNIYDKVKDNYKSLHQFLCDYSGKKVSTITINGEYKIYVYSDNGDLVYSTPHKDLLIIPNDDISESYFNNLNYVERRLLNRNTYPIYTCKFEYRLDGKNITSNCTFPSDGYSIEVDTPAFESYVQKLIDIANVYDLTKSNVINGKLVHESIKILDWSSRHQGAKNSDEEFSYGLNRMESFFHILGRAFDDVKNLIDTLDQGDKYNLKHHNHNTEILVSEAKYRGWELFKLFDYTHSFKVDKDRWYKNLLNQKIDGKYVTDDFVKKLLHFSTPILTRKGTLECVRQIMALFSFENEKDYTLREVYHRFNNLLDPSKFVELYEKLQEHIFDNVDTDPTNLIPHRIKDGAVEPFLGDKIVDDKDLYFHSLGSWVKFSDDKDNKYDYLETQSYLKSVNHIEDLTLINSYETKYDEPHYVVNVDKFHNYFPNDELTHYFHLEDINNPQHVSSWRPITPTHELWEKVEYLNKIINDTTDNNPHTGFGRYDMGLYYINSLINPFRYYIKEFNVVNRELVEEVDSFSLEQEEYKTTSKIFVQKNIEEFNETRPYDKDDVVYINRPNGKSFYRCIEIDVDTDKPFEERSNKFVPYIPDTTLYKSQLYTLINTKTLVFENKIDNPHFKQFLRKSILPYIYQIIPSTTTLIVLNS